MNNNNLKPIQELTKLSNFTFKALKAIPWEMRKVSLLIILIAYVTVSCGQESANNSSSFISGAFSLKWTDNGNTTYFIFTTNMTLLGSDASSPFYTSFAFSTDQDMVLCKGFFLIKISTDCLNYRAEITLWLVGL